MSSGAQRFIQLQGTLKVLNAHRNVLLNLEGNPKFRLHPPIPVIAIYTKTRSERSKQSNSTTPPQPVRKENNLPRIELLQPSAEPP